MRICLKFLVFTGIFLVGFPLFGAHSKRDEKPVVFVEKAQKNEIFDLLTYPARLVPKINATVLSDTDGVVTSVNAIIGKRVSKNEILLVVKNVDPVFEFAPVRVKAPVKGVVSEIKVTIGSRVVKGQKLAAIVNPSAIKILIEVAALDLRAIKNGLVGELEITGTEEKIPVRVLGVSPFVDPATGTATAELAMTSKSDVPPGLVGKVHFKVREHDGFQFPTDALVYRGKDTFLRIINDNKASLTPVTVGRTRRGIVEIVKGLKENSVVVVRTNKFISDGEEVTVEKKKSR